MTDVVVADTCSLLNFAAVRRLDILDDAAAVDYARRRGLDVVDSTDVMSEAYERAFVGCPEAFDLLVAMRAAARGVRVPPTHSQVCPP